MRRGVTIIINIKYRVIAAVSTFVVGVVIAWVVGAVWKIAQVAEQEHPPCKACSRIYSTTATSVSICEIHERLEEYRGKLVRVRANLQHDAGQVSLFDDACPEGSIHAGLSNSCQSCVGTLKALSIFSGFGTWYDSTAHVEVLGRVGRLENATLFEDENGFNIDCVESVEPIGSTTDLRIRYTLGKVLRLNPNHR